MDDQGDNNVPHLEQLLLKQDTLVEKLLEDLKNEKEKVKQLKEDEIRKESMHSKQMGDIEIEVNRIKKLLFDNGITEASQDSFNAFKLKLEERVRNSLSKNANTIRLDCRNELELLKRHYEEEMNKMVETTRLRESLLDKQIGLLSNAVTKFNNTYSNFEDIWKFGNNQIEMDHLNKSLDAIKKTGNDLLPSVALLSQRVVDSIYRETNLWKELYTFKTEYIELRKESTFLKQMLGKYECVSPDIKQCVESEQYGESSNYDKRICLMGAHSLNEKGNCKNDVLDASNEIDSLLIYIKKLNKYLRDMSIFYNKRLNKLIDADGNSPPLTSLVSLLDDNKHLPAETVLLKSDKLLSDLKECHRLIFCLNEILKSFDLNFDKNVKLLSDKLSKLEITHQEKVFSLDSHIKFLNEKIAVCLKENKHLETEITRIRMSTMTQEQFDSICAENKKYIELNKKLEEQLAVLKCNSFMIDKETSINPILLSNNSDAESPTKVGSHDCSDSSLFFGNLLPITAITSTPFHSKAIARSELYSGMEVLKSALLEWIERCQNIDSEKKQLEKRLFHLNLIFNQTTITKNVLEQEIELLRENVKQLKEKVDDYVLLKEKNHILENDNSMLNIKVKFLSEIHDYSGREKCLETVTYTKSSAPFDLELFDATVSKVDFIHEFQKKNQQIIHLESQCRSKDAFNDELSLKLNQAREMENILESKVAGLISSGNSVQEKLFSLIEENSVLYTEKMSSEIELKSTKDQLNYFISSSDAFKVNSNDLVEAMKNDTLKILKDSIEMWSKMEEKFVGSQINDKKIDRLDARHIVEILTEDNSLLKHDNEELLLKLTKLQHQVNALQNNEDIDEGWFLEMEKYERELIKELKEQREQHARIEGALRSTGNLHDELQKQHDLHRSRLVEISSLKKQLEDQKHKISSSANQYILIENDLKQKDKMLQETLDEKNSYKAKLGALERELAKKEKTYQNELLHTKWMSQYSQNKSVDTVVKRNINELQSELIAGLAEREKNRYESMDVVYQQSIESLRYLLQQDKEAALVDLSHKHQKKINDYVNLLMDQVSKINDLETKKNLELAGVNVDTVDKCNLSEVDRNKDKINKELLDIELSIKEIPENERFIQYKKKLSEYFDLLFISSMHRLKEEHKTQSDIAFKALKELHSEEIMIVKLKKDAENSAALYNLAQDQLKREKDLINSLSQSEMNSQSSVFNQFRVSVIKLFLKYVQMFIPSWAKMYNKDLEALEKKYIQYLSDYFNETDNSPIEVETSKEIENIICNQSLIINNSQDFVKKLDDCLTNLLKSSQEFFKNNCDQLTNAVKSLKSNDCPEKMIALHQQINTLKLEKNELEEKHRAAVQLLVSDHEDELLKVRSLVEELHKNSSCEQNILLDKLRFELEEKHTREVEDLRTYFERKCAELEKHYSEEIFSHQSRKMSITSSSSESELVSEENSMDPPFHATLIVTDDCMLQVPEGTNLLNELYSNHDAESGLLVERYFVDLNAMDQVLLKHKLVVDRVVSFWKTRLDMLYSKLEIKHSLSLDQRFMGFKDIEERVGEIMMDVREESLRELDWINLLQTSDIHEQSLRSDMEKQYEGKISSISDDYENRLTKEMSKLTQIYKKRELEAVWAARVESEQASREEIQSLESKWEKKYVSDMASFLSQYSIQKVHFEENLKDMLYNFNAALSQRFNSIERTVLLHISRLNTLTNKLPALSKQYRAELMTIKEQFEIEKAVIHKNCNNLISQMEIDNKYSCDALIYKYEKELDDLTLTHREEMKYSEEKHHEQMAELKKKIVDISVLSDNETLEKARNLASDKLIKGILDYLSKKESFENDDKTEVNIPPEISLLESYFENNYKKVIDAQANEYHEELRKLKEKFENQVDLLNQIRQEDVDSDSSRLVNFSCQTCVQGNSQELDKIIKERNALRKLSESLKSAVSQLSTYLYSCEDELNRTVVEQLLKAASSSTENSPVKTNSVGSMRRVHFAPDVSRILESSVYEDNTSVDISCLDDPDVSLMLKHELDSCLSKLKQEAATILGLSVYNRPVAKLLPTLKPLSDMAKRLFSDKVSPSAVDIMNVIDELTLEGDRIIEELQHEKLDLQQQINAADYQLRSTRKFLEDQAVEREAERDEYSRELSLLQAHIRQVTPDNRHQTLVMQVEELEKQVTDTCNNLKNAETRKKELEQELKGTVEKVWVLTDIINKLESQILVKSEREECLEKRLDELEAELEQQSLAQEAMVQEMESLKSREDNEGNYMGQIAALQEEMKLQYSSNSIRNIKAQLREIELGIESRTKELEGLNLNSSTTSLSSPSEEISIREHIEMFRCHTPEFCPSPVALPIDEVNKLQDKTQRLIRSEEMIIKKVKDQDLQIKKLSQILNEVQAEREALQHSVEKLNNQLGLANTKVDDLRRKAETARSSANKAHVEKISILEEEVKHLKCDLDQTKTQLLQKEDQLKLAKELIDSQNVKLRSLSQSDPEITNALRLELASVITEKNKLEELLDRYKSEAKAIDMSPLYSCLLNDKNEDIQQLQRTVSLLQNQTHQDLLERGCGDHGPPMSGKTVSFAEELSPIGRSVSPLRDAPRMSSYTFSSQINETDKPISVTASGSQPLEFEPSLTPINSMFSVNSYLGRSENEKVSKLESEVKSLRSLVNNLSDAKKDVESYISSFTDDRKYYESQLNKLLDEKKFHEDEIDKLRQMLERKDNEIKNTTGDVNKLQVILRNLQEKLQQASKLASKDNDLKQELSEMKEKCSTLEDVLSKFYKFRDDLGALNEDFVYRENNTYDYFQNILNALRQKLRKTTDIEMSNSNLRRQMEGINDEISKLKQENNHLVNEVVSNKEMYKNEITNLKLRNDEISQQNFKLQNDNLNYIQLKQDNIELTSNLEKSELSKNLMEVEVNSLRSENNKLAEELECITTELKFKNVNNNYKVGTDEKEDSDNASTPAKHEHVADLDDLTCEIEKQLDLSAKLDNSLLNALGDKTCYKKDGAVGSAISSKPESTRVPITNTHKGYDGTNRGLVSWLANEVDAWQSASSKQNQLSSQLNNLSRVVQTQDNRITRLLIELDDKKKECLVMELDLLKERSNLKQTQCLLETERQRARSIQKEDTHLIETLRIRLEAALKAESNLKNLLLEERQKCETLEACLNSAKALESYVQTSSDSDTSQNFRAQLVLRIEVDRLKQVNNDLENVILRERNSQLALKEKIKLLQVQNQLLENQVEELSYKLNEEVKLRESMESQLRQIDKNVNNPSIKMEKDMGSRFAMESVLSEIKLWKDECLQLRECIRLQREHEDYWSANVQTPLIKQLNDVNRSLEALVREKVTLQTYVGCIEKERDFLRSRVEKLEELNEKLSGSNFSLSPQITSKLNLQSVLHKLQYLAEINHRMESHRKALIWQKRYLLVAIKSYQKTTAESIGRFDATNFHSKEKKKICFRTVVHVIRACIKLNYIHKRRKASRKCLVNKMTAEIHLPSTPKVICQTSSEVVNSGGPNFMSLSPPSRDLYAVPSAIESTLHSSVDQEPSKLSHYIAMFDQMQKRLGKIIQNENL